MKFIVNIKDPDVLDDAIEEAVQREVPGDLDDDIRDTTLENMKNKCHSTASKFVKYGEYYRIEFDTIAHTATVLEKLP